MGADLDGALLDYLLAASAVRISVKCPPPRTAKCHHESDDDEHATAAASLAVAVLLVAAILRRLWLAHKGVPIGVAGLWCLGVVAGLFLSAAGSLLGRRLMTDRH